MQQSQLTPPRDIFTNSVLQSATAAWMWMRFSPDEQLMKIGLQAIEPTTTDDDDDDKSSRIWRSAGCTLAWYLACWQAIVGPVFVHWPGQNLIYICCLSLFIGLLQHLSKQ